MDRVSINVDQVLPIRKLLYCPNACRSLKVSLSPAKSASRKARIAPYFVVSRKSIFKRDWLTVNAVLVFPLSWGTGMEPTINRSFVPIGSKLSTTFIFTNPPNLIAAELPGIGSEPGNDVRSY